ncbi:kynureninase [Zychaea mexicana]|uniref:kynureninase n=1 Tax=Zychaea mexicana TaxID=64656 RepID=UPI0022FDD4BE|nr:kynureninase [Zychaea mexicana]KAI9488503.1 kynureninase [Zychaea mexicana]
MGTLTANLHAMMAAFYRPTAERFKIIIEAKAFPSDHYAVTSQIQLHGYDPSVCLVTIAPRQGEATLRTEDIIEAIQKDDAIALVLLSGVQYYTGQFFEMEKITKAGHDQGCVVGWDLAHAVGNVPLKLHDWQVDFACWCTYKYLNSGPGNIAGVFVHENHFNDKKRPRLAGWWGNDKTNRFDMAPLFRPSEGASGYQISNPSVINVASLMGSLELFESATMPKLREKSLRLTAYLEYLLITKLQKKHMEAGHFEILTPSNPEERGCQLSLDFPEKMLTIFDALQSRGVVCDERKPTVIRIAPTPLYNTYTDVYYCVSYLEEILDQVFA